jgi:hypothetical protein
MKTIPIKTFRLIVTKLFKKYILNDMCNVFKHDNETIANDWTSLIEKVYFHNQ